MSSAIRRHKPPTNAQVLPSTTATGAGRRRQTASTEKGATSPIITTPAQNSGAMLPLISDWAEVPAGPSEAKQLARKPAKTSASTMTKTISSGSSALVASCMPGEAKRKNAVTMSAASPHAKGERRIHGEKDARIHHHEQCHSHGHQTAGKLAHTQNNLPWSKLVFIAIPFAVSK